MNPDVARIRKRFLALPGKVEAAVKRQMEINAGELVEAMRYNAPFLTGALRDSINWTWGAAPKGSLAIGSYEEPGHGLTITVYVGTRDKSLGDRDAYYARWQEFGTRNMTANPFFYVTFRKYRRRFAARVMRAAKKAMQG